MFYPNSEMSHANRASQKVWFWNCKLEVSQQNQNNIGQQVCHFSVANTRDAEQILSYAAREHSYSLCNSGTTGCTCDSYVGWVTVNGWAAQRLVTVCVHLLKKCFVCVSPAQFCPCFLQLISGEVGASLSQELHNFLVPKLVIWHVTIKYN